MTIIKYNMPTLVDLRKSLEHHNLSAVAKDADVSYFALHRFMSGAQRPAYDTIKSVCEYLNRQAEIGTEIGTENKKGA